MGINVYTGEIIHASTIADCFHIDMRVVKRWIEKLGLPAKISQHDNATWYRIEQKDFWKWAEQNRSSINWEKYELRSLPPEPEWVKEEKKTYTTPKHRTTVTKEDVYKVQCLLHRGMSFPEIGREIGRTTESAKHIARKYRL